MIHVEVVLTCSLGKEEIVVGMMSQFDEILSMEILEGKVNLYLVKPNFEKILSKFDLVVKDFGWSYNFTELEPKNWNEEWEKNFNPIAIGDKVLVRADFHGKNPAYEYELIINPKNAFGTGHHETTHMMMEEMISLSWQGMTLLDFGTGTGILSVWSHLLGCREITAIDNTLSSIENTMENFVVNNIDPTGYTILQQTLDNFIENSYDIILANINLNVLLTYADQLIGMLNPKGKLLLSGILIEDQEKIKNAYHKLSLIELKEKGEWSLFHYRAGGGSRQKSH